ncbi:MAG: hypothetical protein HYZ00_01715, partial [Candidatus Hydrogenedentes bacterium]|nr:hypothetical protein [Candidatus Hydrogenedentota bacterium]
LTQDQFDALDLDNDGALTEEELKEVAGITDGCNCRDWLSSLLGLRKSLGDVLLLGGLLLAASLLSRARN